MRLPLPALAALLLLSACHKAPPAAKSLDAMDNALVSGSVSDESPANHALASAIHVDPAKAHDNAVALVTRKGMPSVTEGTCLSGLIYSNDWAAKLPADLPMLPKARLQEAAGHDGPCRARVASFAVPGDRPAVMDWYRTRAASAGYAVEREDKGGDWILSGEKGEATFIIIVGAPSHGETPVDYIWARG